MTRSALFLILPPNDVIIWEKVYWGQRLIGINQILYCKQGSPPLFQLSLVLKQCMKLAYGTRGVSYTTYAH